MTEEEDVHDDSFRGDRIGVRGWCRGGQLPATLSKAVGRMHPQGFDRTANMPYKPVVALDASLGRVVVMSAAYRTPISVGRDRVYVGDNISGR